MADIDTLKGLLERVRRADLPDRDLDGDLWEGAVSKVWRYPLSGPWVDTPHYPVPCITASIDAARTAHAKALPNFWISSGVCSLSAHASTGPDYNDPAGDALRAAWPEERFHEGFHADLASGDRRYRECYAILDVTLQALLAQAEAPFTSAGGKDA